MKIRKFVLAMCALIMFAYGVTVRANDIHGGDIGCGSCDTGCSTCDAGCSSYGDAGMGHAIADAGMGFEGGCCNQSAWIFDLEATLFRYHRADGVRVGDDRPGDDAEFDFEIAPRVTVGYVSSNGLGARLRWWDYHHNAVANEGAPSRIDVDTFTIDFELFRQIELSCDAAVEFSAGLRYNDFQEKMFDLVADNEFRLNQFAGYGGVVGLQVYHSIGIGGRVYARARGAILMSDKSQSNTGSGIQELLDVTVGMTEIGLGYEYQTCWGGAVITLRSGVEWQNWYNYSSNFTTGTADPEQFFTGASDVGFGGFVVGLGVNY